MTQRILHVVGNMNAGGVETWLMHVLRHMPRHDWAMDFLVASETPGLFDPEIAALGAQRFVMGDRLRRPRHFHRRLRDFLADSDYAIVHSHVNAFSGVVLDAAWRAGVPGRIAHSHRVSELPATALIKRTARQTGIALIKQRATAGIGISEAAAAALFGPAWRSDGRWRIIHYGFTYDHFHGLPAPAQAKEAVGLPPEAIVVGHVGNFAPVKNHVFLVDVFAQLVARGSADYLLLVGDGRERARIDRRVQALGLQDRVVMVGAQPQVAGYLAAMDLKLFPSVVEGFGIVALEAQAAGTPVLASTAIPPEVDVVPGGVARLPLAAGVDAWADKAQQCLATPLPDQSRCLHQVESSPFGIQHCLAALDDLYSRQLERAYG